MTVWCKTLVSLALIVVMSGCGGDAQPSSGAQNGSSETLDCVASFHPVAYFAERIAGLDATVNCPLPADADPAYWKADEAALSAMANADLIFVNGAKFEKWLATTSLPDSRVIRTANGFKDQWLDYGEGFTHSHGPAGEHSHAGTDGHTWLDPLLAKKQAEAIRNAMIQKRPTKEESFRKNAKALLKDLDGLHKSLSAIDASGRTFCASHPAYNYPAKRYGWSVINLDLDPEEMPSEETLTELAHDAQATGAKFLVWEAQPTAVIVARIKKDCGLSSVVASPAELVEKDSGTNYLTIMKANVEVIRKVMTETLPR